MYYGAKEADRNGFIQALADQYHGLEKVNTPSEFYDILQPVFARMPRQEKIELSYEFQFLMMQWNGTHVGQESDNPYASVFHYLNTYR